MHANAVFFQLYNFRSFNYSSSVFFFFRYNNCIRKDRSASEIIYYFRNTASLTQGPRQEWVYIATRTKRKNLCSKKKVIPVRYKLQNDKETASKNCTGMRKEEKKRNSVLFFTRAVSYTQEKNVMTIMQRNRCAVFCAHT